jgi:hypothetical protein
VYHLLCEYKIRLCPRSAMQPACGRWQLPFVSSCPPHRLPSPPALEASLRTLADADDCSVFLAKWHSPLELETAMGSNPPGKSHPSLLSRVHCAVSARSCRLPLAMAAATFTGALQRTIFLLCIPHCHQLDNNGGRPQSPRSSQPMR